MSTDTTAVPDTESGLSNVTQIEALADELSKAADKLSERLQADMDAAKAGAVFSPAHQHAVRTLFDEEQVLRQRANGLYAVAATAIVQSLGESQQQIIKLTADAGEKIRKIAVIGSVTGLVSGLVMLAGAVATGQPAPIVLAIEKIRRQSKRLDALTPKKPG